MSLRAVNTPVSDSQASSRQVSSRARCRLRLAAVSLSLSLRRTSGKVVFVEVALGSTKSSLGCACANGSKQRWGFVWLRVRQAFAGKH